MMKRRDFMTVLGAGLTGRIACGNPHEARQPLLFGICADPSQAEALRKVGFDFIEGTVEQCMKPALSDEAFAPELEKLKRCALPIRSLTGFFPSGFRLTGPDADHDKALAHAVRMCRRADAAGIPFIVLGSGGARQFPPGFPPENAKRQLIDFCKALASQIADLRVTIVLEPLNKEETNLLNTVAEGIEYLDAIGHPRIQLLADFYHMRCENENAGSILKAGPRLRHCHIAEKNGRTPPGTHGEDLGDLFAALRKTGYAGGVSCECRWPQGNLEPVWEKALDTMRQQSAPPAR